LRCFLINWSSVLCRTSGLAKGSWIQLGFQYFSEVLNFNHRFSPDTREKSYARCFVFHDILRIDCFFNSLLERFLQTCEVQISQNIEWWEKKKLFISNFVWNSFSFVCNCFCTKPIEW
jgi:hypothetical protein